MLLVNSVFYVVLS